MLKISRRLPSRSTTSDGIPSRSRSRSNRRMVRSALPIRSALCALAGPSPRGRPSPREGPSSLRNTTSTTADPSPQHLGDQECQFQGLLRIEARIAGRLVAVLEIQIRDVLRATEAFGDVLAGELDVQAAWMRAQGVMDLEEALHLVDDAIEVAGRCPRGRLLGG